jgi:hypothetical protein
MYFRDPQPTSAFLEETGQILKKDHLLICSLFNNDFSVSQTI